MTTIEKVILDARALLDEYTKDGVVIPSSDVSDIIAKGIRFADMAQKELFRTGNLYKKFEVTQKPQVNLLGYHSNFNIVEHLGVDTEYTSPTPARSYYFEADGDGVAYIEVFDGGQWLTVEVIQLVADGFMVAYKGIVPQIGTQTRIRFSGNFFYQHQNRALFSAPYPLSRVPNYRPWITYTMPDDFRMVDVVIEEFPVRQYEQSATYKWEGFKDLVVNYYFEGTIRVIYKPVPTTITSIAQILEVDDITANAITYYVAAKLAPEENKQLTNFFEGKYNELKLESFYRMPSTEQSIIDVYGVRHG